MKAEVGFAADSFRVSSADGRNFTLLDAVAFTAASGEIITIPAGAQSDGASTPPEVWPLIPPFGKYWRAAYLHDFLYRYTTRPKAECDRLLLEAMASLGVGEVERYTIFEAVNRFGQAAFDGDRAARGKAEG